MANEYYKLNKTAEEVIKALDNALNPDTTLTENGKPADAGAVKRALDELKKIIPSIDGGTTAYYVDDDAALWHRVSGKDGRLTIDETIQLYNDWLYGTAEVFIGIMDTLGQGGGYGFGRCIEMSLIAADPDGSTVDVYATYIGGDDKIVTVRVGVSGISTALFSR